jgi:hypothetical protein
MRKSACLTGFAFFLIVCWLAACRPPSKASGLSSDRVRMQKIDSLTIRIGSKSYRFKLIDQDTVKTGFGV